MNKCKECGSEKIIPDVPLLDYFSVGSAAQTNVTIHGAPQAWVFKDTAKGGVSLSVCGECGYAELRVSNARQLWEKYQQARET